MSFENHVSINFREEYKSSKLLFNEYVRILYDFIKKKCLTLSLEGERGFLPPPPLQFFVCFSYSNQQRLLKFGGVWSNYMGYFLVKK